MRLPRPVPAPAVVAAVCALALVAGCSNDANDSGSSSGSAASADTSPLGFTSCAEAACEGTLPSGAYSIQMPTTWNGTLLLWSHGYRSAIAAPPSFEPVDTSAQDAPSDAVATALLGQGYALAGSSYATNGWAVQDGVKAAEELHDFVDANIGKPRRTYVWGASLGGLISQLVSEKHPEWVSGAAPECGAVAGTTENLDGALAVGYMVKTLIDPGLKITNFTSPAEAVANFQRAQKSVTAAATDVAGGGTAKVQAIAAIAHLTDKTATYDGHDLPSTVGAHAESIITALGFTTFGQQEFATRVGGQGLDITGLDFSSSIDVATVGASIKQVGGDLDAYLTELAAGQRPAVDPAAREKARAQGETTGNIDHPTVTLHTVSDPLVVVANERVLGDRVFASEGDLDLLVQLYSRAPDSYTAPAPYGAGHCNFTTTEQLGLVRALDDFVRTGVRPTPAGLTSDFAQPTGFDPTFAAPAFPLLAP